MTKAERLEKMRQRLEEMQVYERDLRSQGIRYIGGIDEVGRGPLAGPVVTACVVLPEDFSVLGVDDSKKISEKRRNELYEAILEAALAYGIGIRTSEAIDQINILEATKEAMMDAAEEANRMLEGKLEHVLIDAVRLPDLDLPQTSIIKGDATSLSIAAASIVAKVTRDRMMIEYAQQYPGYAWEKNKGYGTKEHYQGLREHGITPIHRRSFLKNFEE